MQSNICFPQELLEEIETYAVVKGLTVKEFVLWSLGEKIGELRQRLGVTNLSRCISNPSLGVPEASKKNDEPFNPKTLLNAAVIAKYLKISRSASYKLMRSGSIPVVNIGKNVRVRSEDID